MRKRQKHLEKFLVRTFLENVLRRTVRRLFGRHPPRPDVYAVVDTDIDPAVLEIEVVEYQVDAPSEHQDGSPGERLNSFWRKVQDSLARRLTKKPIEVDVTVTLKDTSTVRTREARDLAEELVRLARGFDFSASNTASLTSFQPEFPLLGRYVRTLRLKKVSYVAIWWACSDTSVGSVGVSPRIVARLIREKSNKQYKWAKNAQKWLLVCASGRSIVGHAGPPVAAAALQEREVLDVARVSPFDRVYFTDLTRRWQKCLK